MLIAIFVAAAAIYAAVGAQDLRQRQVSNYFCAGIAGLGIIRWALLMQVTPALWAAAAALLLFCVGLFFFSRGWLGGGDVKLISATALLLGAPEMPAFLFLMSLIGAALALIVLIYIRFGHVLRNVTPDSGGADPAPDRSKVPYAVAVALSATIIFFLQIQRA